MMIGKRPQHSAAWGAAVKKLLTAIIVAAVATPAFAQIMPSMTGPQTNKLKTDVEIKAEQDRENGYKSGLAKIPDQKAKADPWGTVRDSTPPAKVQAKPVPKQ